MKAFMRITEEKRAPLKETSQLSGPVGLPAISPLTLLNAEIDIRLSPWKGLVGGRDLPINRAEVTQALSLIDPDLRPFKDPSLITCGARDRVWKSLSQGEVKAALIAAMLCFEAFSRISNLKEINKFNLPSSDFVIRVIESTTIDPDTKGLAVLIMLQQQIGTLGIQALRQLSSLGQPSEFLSSTMEAATRRLNNALKAV